MVLGGKQGKSRRSAVGSQQPQVILIEKELFSCTFQIIFEFKGIIRRNYIKFAITIHRI
jgi:hypothetical protein